MKITSKVDFNRLVLTFTQNLQFQSFPTRVKIVTDLLYESGPLKNKESKVFLNVCFCNLKAVMRLVSMQNTNWPFVPNVIFMQDWY